MIDNTLAINIGVINTQISHDGEIISSVPPIKGITINTRTSPRDKIIVFHLPYQEAETLALFLAAKFLEPSTNKSLNTNNIVI